MKMEGRQAKVDELKPVGQFRFDKRMPTLRKGGGMSVEEANG